MNYVELEERNAIREMDEYPTLELARKIYPSLIKWEMFIAYKNSRRQVCLTFKSGYKRKIAYARFLYECWNGVLLNWRYHVDHINNIKTDDRLVNLQVLSASENSKKLSQHRKQH